MSTPTVRRDWAPEAVRIIFGIIWAIDAWLKWQPGFRTTFLPNMITTAGAEPHWLAPWFAFVLRVLRTAPHVWPYLAAGVETTLAITLLLGVGRRAVYAGGAVYGMSIWCTADGFGAPYGPGATDIGPGIIYALVFVSLLVMLERGHGGHLALDAVLVRRVPWWSRLAGPVGAGAAPAPAKTVAGVASRP
ncbi:hypothetical protein MSM1_10180 [Mycobacterium sp. SM1]|uniref:hypothetical protein n=1 Tax=Mycobacterium sp. SM1 TaxID=2816243 RepID=UPI001BCC2783|nr:hypothetical protein [Mycobacterium sp. SM1]MBS4728682.1 hypothetical protein [Mycobacterium sp. SM1]